MKLVERKKQFIREYLAERDIVGVAELGRAFDPRGQEIHNVMMYALSQMVKQGELERVHNPSTGFPGYRKRSE